MVDHSHSGPTVTVVHCNKQGAVAAILLPEQHVSPLCRFIVGLKITALNVWLPFEAMMSTCDFHADA